MFGELGVRAKMSIAEKIGATKENAKSHSLEMIVFPIFIICFMGIIANNMLASGFQTTPTLPSVCTDVNGNPSPLCFPTQTSPCDNSIANCNLTSNYVWSFLNPNSPFTLAVQGNILGFISSVLNAGEVQNTYNNGYTSCFPTFLTNFTLYNDTTAGIRNFQCYAYVVNNGAGNPMNPPTIVEVVNATSDNGNASIWTLQGCPYANSIQKFPTNTTIGGKASSCGINYGGNWQTVVSNMFYIINGSQIKSSGCTVFGQSYSICGIFWKTFFAGGATTFTCPNTVNDATNHTNLWNSSGTSPRVNVLKTSSFCLIPFNIPNNTELGSVFGFWSFVFGAIMLVIGLGITVSAKIAGSGTTTGSNTQGTRQAVILGMFIMLWSFAYSEFGSWQGDLWFGLGTIAFLILASIGFTGVYWRFFSYD